MCAKECEAAEAVARLKEEAKEQKEKLGILQQKLLKAQAKEIPVEDMTLVSVSYTHLDVYKRQPVAQGIEHRPPEAGAAVRIRPGVYFFCYF